MTVTRDGYTYGPGWGRPATEGEMALEAAQRLEAAASRLAAAAPPAADPTLYPYQVVTARLGSVITVRSFWAADDDKARASAGELQPGHYLFRTVERASPGKGGVI